MAKTVTIEIPKGKRAEWRGGAIVFVDENQPDVRDRIKTFEDALKELDSTHPLVEEYYAISPIIGEMSKELLAYLKLRIITAALNEGWQPQYTKDEKRWDSWHYLYTQEEYDKLSKEDKSRCVQRSGGNSGAYSGLAYSFASYASSGSYSTNGGRLIFRSEELAAYAGRQFIDLYADFLLLTR